MNQTEEQKTEIDKHMRVLKEKLKRFFSEETPPDVLIIKSHLICEYYLNQILILKDKCNANQINRLSFYEKNDKAFDKDDKKQKTLFDLLRVLNKLRNKVGHELEYVLSESDVDSLGFLFGKEYVLEKYDFETLREQLRNTLMLMVIDVAFVVFDIVNHQKKKIIN